MSVEPTPIRVQSSAEEAMAWQLRAAGLPPAVREYRFSPPRRFRFDFAWLLPLRIALEVDGGTWTGGRHTRGAGFERDCEKFNEAAIAGWLVLRVTPSMVDDGRALALVERAIGERAA